MEKYITNFPCVSFLTCGSFEWKLSGGLDCNALKGKRRAESERQRAERKQIYEDK